MKHINTLPDILVGPLLRRISTTRLVLWIIASRPLNMALVLRPGQSDTETIGLTHHQQCIAIGQHAFIHLIDIGLESPLPCDERIEYDLQVETPQGDWRSLPEWAPWLCYAGATYPAFVIASRHHRLMHGSCRKPHHDSADGLVRADSWLAEQQAAPTEWPAWLLMTGDQVYADDVAGPMLRAVHALIERLGLVDEWLEGATVDDSQALYQSPDSYYRRAELLPDVTSNAALRERFFGGVKKPVFTSANAQNHLMTLAEMLAMYCLVWSPVPWQVIAPTPPGLDEKDAELYRQEQVIIDAFVAGLPQCARLMAHLPSLMIFDDNPNVAA
ncbi:MAG: hypothetical protein ACTIJ3_09985 [Halomonadaceae bacterium]|uniref:hypothetical protein n=1 Tax=unclassified Halomonas TaxID=2609666 RepID=UPI003FDA877C